MEGRKEGEGGGEEQWSVERFRRERCWWKVWCEAELEGSSRTWSAERGVDMCRGFRVLDFTHGNLKVPTAPRRTLNNRIVASRPSNGCHRAPIHRRWRHALLVLAATREAHP